MAAFHQAGMEQNRDGGFLLEARAPCLILIEGNKLFVSDLTFSGKKMRIKWNSRVFEVDCPAGGATVEATPEIEPK